MKRKRTTQWQAVMAAGLLLAASAPRAELAGRFFFTPQERALLNSQRNKSVGLVVGGESITVNGLVSRSSGKSSIWINGMPLNENERVESVTILHKQPAGGKVTVRLPDSTQSVGMRVGQTLDGATGKVREVYDPPQNKEAAEEDIE